MLFEARSREYELLGKIGDGAVGLVRKARDRKSNRVVAVKFLAPDPKYIDVQAFDEVAGRFKREGIRGAALTHDHLIKILAYEDNTGGECFRRKGMGNPFIVMEFVRGRTAESLIKSLGRPAEGGVHITVQTLTIAHV
jgi:serine/threonine protein kinase